MASCCLARPGVPCKHAGMVSYKNDIAAAQERVEAWWRHEVSGRPVMLLTAPDVSDDAHSAPPVSQPDDLDRWWSDPTHVIPRLKRALASTYYGGEALPLAFPVSPGLVSITNKYLGAPNIFVNQNTTWSEPIISDWTTRPKLQFDAQNDWWRRTVRLLEAGVAMVRELGAPVFLGIPDLNGPTEILSGLRGQQRFAMDFYDNPDEIDPALREVQDAWFEVYKRCTAIAHTCGGYFCWMGVWSERPMIDLQSDFSCLISSEMFDHYLLPYIVEQARAIERTIYHLDGPGAVRHLDSLLAVEEINAIQWIQGAGAGRMSEWIGLLKRIQDGGKLISVTCDPDEVPLLQNALDSSSLMLVVSAGSRSEADELIRNADHAAGVGA